MQVYGHRGAAGEAPENTIRGMRHLINLGVTRAEIDLHLSADGQIVVIHDESLWRTCRRPGQIASLSAAAAARRSDVGQYPVPTLADLLRACPELTHVQLEIKSAPPAHLRDLALALSAVLSEVKQPLTAFTATSSDPAALAAVAQQLPGLSRGVVMTDLNQLSWLHRYHCRLACVAYGLLNRWLVSHLDGQRVKVSTWTVNQPQQMLRCRRLGCASVITDLPAIALRTL